MFAIQRCVDARCAWPMCPRYEFCFSDTLRDAKISDMHSRSEVQLGRQRQGPLLFACRRWRPANHDRESSGKSPNSAEIN
jgi:hypothetical protein